MTARHPGQSQSGRLAVALDSIVPEGLSCVYIFDVLMTKLPVRELWPVAGLWIDSDAPPVKPVRETGTQMMLAIQWWRWLSLSVGDSL